MARTTLAHNDLQALLDSAIAEYGVPGAATGVVRVDGDGRIDLDCVWSGITNQATGYPVIGDTLFQIGSISKIFTTVLAMQLVDEGRISLDTRAREILPDFRVQGASDITEHCTIRHLMNHTSGIEGDAFPDNLGRGDDCVAKYVRYIGDFPARSPLGGPLSYSNGAFVVLGRVVEVLRGMTWDEAVRKYIAQPAGFGHIWTLPEDVLRFSSALGHNRAIATDQPTFPAPVRPSPVWNLPRSSGPCGQISASIGDLMGFVSVFLRDGIAPNGTRLLSQHSAMLMTKEQVSLRDQGIENIGWALGWQLPNWGDEPAFGHGGATEGQRANVVVFPKRGLAIATLTNADAGTQMAAQIARTVAKREAGIAPPPEVVMNDRAFTSQEIADMRGTYAREGEEYRIVEGGPTGLLMVIEPDDDDGPMGVRLTLPLHHTDQGFYAVQRPDQRTPTEIAFLRVERSNYAPYRVYLAQGHRITPRIR